MYAQVQRLIHLASNRAGEVMQELNEVLQKHEASRVSMRVRRHASASQQQGSASRAVTVLPPGDVTGALIPTLCQAPAHGPGWPTRLKTIDCMRASKADRHMEHLPAQHHECCAISSTPLCPYCPRSWSYAPYKSREHGILAVEGQ